MASTPPELENVPGLQTTRDPVIAPRVPFDVFMQWFKWRQGQHLALIGPTGSGKTTLAIALLPMQPYVSVLATKPRDSTMDRLAKSGYKIFRQWPTYWPYNSPKRYPRRIIWPKHFGLGKEPKDKMRQKLLDAMSKAFLEGNWCVYSDEIYYLSDELGLKGEIKQYLLQGRSLGISLCSSTQRPAWIPLEVYSQSTHLFLWQSNDQRDLERLGEISGKVDKAAARNYVRNLDGHEFLYINTRTGGMIRSTAPKSPIVRKES